MNKLIYFLLYFSEGAPIGLIWWALPSLLVDHGHSVSSTATVSAIASLPWSLKFMLAPLVDLISIKKISYKLQLVAYQLIMGLSLFYLPQSFESHDLTLLIYLLLFHGLFAALQDICIDALAITNIPQNEVGQINGYMQSGMLVGRSLLGGGGVYLAASFGIPFLTYFLISCVYLSLFFVMRTPFRSLDQSNLNFKQYILDFINLVKGQKFWTLVGLTYFAGMTYSGVSTIGSAMLKQFVNSNSIHAAVYGLAIPIVMSIGAILGGKLIDSHKQFQTLVLSILGCAFTSILLSIQFDFYLNLFLFICGYLLYYFFIGAVTASLYGYLMKNTSKEFPALEYSIFMAFVNLSDSSTSFLLGKLINHMSYTFAALFLSLISLFPLLFLLKSTKQRN